MKVLCPVAKHRKEIAYYMRVVTNMFNIKIWNFAKIKGGGIAGHFFSLYLAYAPSAAPINILSKVLDVNTRRIAMHINEQAKRNSPDFVCKKNPLKNNHSAGNISIANK